MDKFQHQLMVETICTSTVLSTEQLKAFTLQCSYEFMYTGYTLSYYIVRLARLADCNSNIESVQEYADKVILKSDIERYNFNRQ